MFSCRVALWNNGGFLSQLVLHSSGALWDQLREKLDLFDNLDDTLTALQEGHHALIGDETLTELSVKQQMYVSIHHCHSWPVVLRYTCDGK